MVISNVAEFSQDILEVLLRNTPGFRLKLKVLIISTNAFFPYPVEDVEALSDDLVPTALLHVESSHNHAKFVEVYLVVASLVDLKLIQLCFMNKSGMDKGLNFKILKHVNQNTLAQHPKIKNKDTVAQEKNLKSKARKCKSKSY